MSTTYYAVCNVNGPISVRLDGDSEAEALDYFLAAEQDDGMGRNWIDGAQTDAEDDLGINGEDMSEDEFDDALLDAGCEPIKDLGEIVNAHAGTVSHLMGVWYLWAHGDAACEDSSNLTADVDDSRVCVRDSEGGIWWPNDEATAEILSADNPAFRATQICDMQPMRGTWKA